MKEGWEVMKFSEIFDVKSSKRVHKTDWTNEGIPFYRAREVVKLAQNGKVKNELFISEELFHNFIKEKGAPKEGDIIISAVGTLGRCYIVKLSDRFYFKDASVLWFEKTSNVNSYYIEYAFRSELIKKQVLHKSMGATVGTLTISRAKAIQIPIPPLSEQQEIVALLDQAFTAIDQAKANLEQNIENAKELFQSKLHAIFSQTGEDWEEKSLGEVCKLITKGSSPKWQGVNYIDKPGILFVTSENVGNCKILLKKKKYLENKFNEIEPKSILKKGDVLTNIVGASIGRTAIYNLNNEANINQAVCLIRCNTSLLDNNYLMYFLNSPLIKQTMAENETNMARANLSLTFFRNLKINIPSTEEQVKIVELIDNFKLKIDNLIENYQTRLISINNLKKSILQKAFAGELTGKEVVV